MKQEKNYNPYAVIALTFLLCLSIRFVDVLVFRLDETVLNENFIHKLTGILILTVVLRFTGMTWREIGFDFRRFAKPILLGLGLGVLRFAAGYGLEYPGG